MRTKKFCWIPTPVYRTEYLRCGFKWLSWAWLDANGCMYETETPLSRTAPWYLRLFAWLLLVRGRALAIWLLEYAQKTPYTHLGDYMHRWWLIQHPAAPDEPGYGTFRDRLRRLVPFYMRFHWIRLPDAGRHLHDHPFWFYSIILKNGYRQQRFIKEAPALCTVSEGFIEGDINHCKIGDFHRISKVSEGGCLTLVIHGRKVPESWGFMVDGERMHWKDYYQMRELEDDRIWPVSTELKK